MNTFDVIILIFVLIPAVLGYKKGLIKSSISLGSILLGVFLSVKFYKGFALVIQKVVNDQKFVDILAFSIILIVIFILGSFIGKKLSDMNVFTKAIDKLGGIILGGITGILITSILLTIAKITYILPENSIKSSTLYPYVSQAVPVLYETILKDNKNNKNNIFDINSYIKKDTINKK